MRLLCMSDIHGRFDSFRPESLPDADTCIIAGDMTNWGKRNLREFHESKVWMKSLAAKYNRVLWIPGNHELDVLDDEYDDVANVLGINQLAYYAYTGVFNAIGSRTTFRGVSMSPAYNMPALASTWCNMTSRREVEEAAYAIPPCDVLVSHAPPYGCHDAAGLIMQADGTWEKEHIGSMACYDYIFDKHPSLVVCGHVHLCGLLGAPRQKVITTAGLEHETLVVNCAETFAVCENDAAGNWHVVESPAERKLIEA